MLGKVRGHLLGGEAAVKPTKKAREYNETDDQKRVVKWLRDRPDWMVMRLENAARRTPAQAARDKAMGMLPGAPDLVLLYRLDVVFLEMKTLKGEVREEQKQCHEELKKRGQHVLIGWGVEGAIKELVLFEERYRRAE